MSILSRKHLELSILEKQQPQNVTHCIAMYSTNVFTTYTMITTIEMQHLLVESQQAIVFKKIYN